MKDKEMSFEQSLTRLEEIVRSMERGDVALEQALGLFEEGTRLISACVKQLDEAELKVVQLTKGADGAPVETEFSDES